MTVLLTSESNVSDGSASRLRQYLAALIDQGVEALSRERFDFQDDLKYFGLVDRTLFETLYQRESAAISGERNEKAARLAEDLDQVLSQYANYRALLHSRLNRLGPDGQWRSRLYAASRPKSLVVYVTGRCQLHCSYCHIPDYLTDLSDQNMRRAVDFLFSSPSDAPLQIHFFGGEPLLRFPLIRKAVAWIEREERGSERKILYRLSTNALLVKDQILEFLLEKDFFLEASCDGDQKTQLTQRRMGSSGARNYYPDLSKRLELLRQAGVRYHLTMIVRPETVGDLFRNFRFLVEEGHQKIKVDYAVGVSWNEIQVRMFLEQMSRIAEFTRGPGCGELLNLKQRHSEPLCLDGDLLTMNWDGKLIAGAAMFMGFPRKIYTRELEAAPIAEHGLTPVDNFWLMVKANRSGSAAFRRILLNNIAMGRLVHRWGLEHKSQTATPPRDDRVVPIEIDGRREHENPAALRALRQPVADQKKEAVSLFLEGTCDGDCVFCRHINRRFPTLDEIRSRVNQQLDGRLVCIIGDEPLAHPQIIDIVELCRRAGCGGVEIMTSGFRLCDYQFTSRLVKAGASSFSVPLHSDRPGVHDRITGVDGGFQRVVDGIDQAVQLGAKVFVHANLLPENADGIEALAKFVRGRWNAGFAVIPVRPKSSNRPYSELALRCADIRRRELGELYGFPLCVASRGLGTISSSLRFYFDAQALVRPPKCGGCSKRADCPGVFQEYLSLHGDSELEPFP